MEGMAFLLLTVVLTIEVFVPFYQNEFYGVGVLISNSSTDVDCPVTH